LLERVAKAKPPVFMGPRFREDDGLVCGDGEASPAASGNS
jgi:hypothetical protein